MAGIFGEVAGSYDEARPGYSPEIPAAMVAYHGGVPDRLVEIGAGTGRSTETLLRMGAPMTCVEPDPRMAEVLAARFPQVEVVVAAFEEWRPPAGGVSMLACAMAWHWLDPASRNQRAHAALAPGGTLAVFGHQYAYVDPAHAAAVDAAFRSVDPVQQQRAQDWFHADIADSGLFTEVRAALVRRDVELSTEEYLRLVRTFSPYLKKSPEQRSRVLAAVGAAVDGFGGAVVLDLRTTLVLARRPS